VCGKRILDMIKERARLGSTAENNEMVGDSKVLSISRRFHDLEFFSLCLKLLDIHARGIAFFVCHRLRSQILGHYDIVHPWYKGSGPVSLNSPDPPRKLRLHLREIGFGSLSCPRNES